MEEIRAGIEEELWALQQGFDGGKENLCVYLAGFDALTMRFQDAMAAAEEGQRVCILDAASRSTRGCSTPGACASPS